MADKKLFSKPVKRQTMAEQMAQAIEELILSGQLESGAALPTEPELADFYSVSRAVVRDATRILMARGLVEVKHGLGVFVTPPHNEAFGEALLLALRRVSATAWDVEQFEQLIFPEVVALAATTATAAELAAIEQLATAYLARVTGLHTDWPGQEAPAEVLAALKDSYHQLMQAIFNATHNRLLQQLAPPLLQLRHLRTWADDESETAEALISVETGHVERLLAALTSQDAGQARAAVKELMALPPQAIDAMRQTPVGESPHIPLPLSSLRR